jgi:hypothetical protein
MFVRDVLESLRHLQVELLTDKLPHLSLLSAFAVPVLGFFVVAFFVRRKRSNLEVYNPTKWWELTNMRSRSEFDTHGPDWIQAWFSTNDRPIRFVVDSGYCSILPSSMANEFRKMKELCMYKFLATVRFFFLFYYMLSCISNISMVLGLSFPLAWLRWV